MRTKHTLLSFLACLMLAVSAFPAAAQDSSQQVPEDWFLDKPIKSITFQGLNTIKASDLEGITSSMIGKSFNYDDFYDLLDRLFALDYFDDIVPLAVPADANRKSVKLVLEVVERPLVSKIVIEGNNQVRASELKNVMYTKVNDIFNASKVLSDERAIRNLYIEKGFTAVKVSSIYESVDGARVVTFRISEGRQTVVSQILFEGNAAASDKTLKGKLTLKEASLFNKGSYQDSSLEQDKLLLQDFYRSKGYVDMRIVDVKLDSSYNEAKQRDELTITYIIQEGSQYTFGGITFSGNSVFATEQLQSLVKLEEGKIYNESKIQESFSLIQSLYFENGYTSNEFSTRVSKDTENKTVSYAFIIKEGRRSHIENVYVRGNNRTKESVVLREIPIQEGDIFSNVKLYTGLRNLYNLQYFSDVQPEVYGGSEENLINVVFNVEEKSTTNVDAGFTFTGVSDPDEIPIALYAKISDSNLFGEGKQISASTTLSTNEQSVELSYGQNWMFDLPIATSFSAGYSHSNSYSLINKYLPTGEQDDSDYYMEYQEHELSLSASIGRRWTPDWAIITASAGMSGSLVNNEYDPTLFDPVDSSISDFNNNWEPRNTIWASVSVDDRDIYYEPSTGWFLNERLTWYGLTPKGMLPFAPDWGESQFMLRSDTKSEIYFTLMDKPVTDSWNLKLVLMGYSGVSMIFPAFDSSVKKSNQLYIDGMFSGRGWTTYTFKRGLGVWNNTLELRCPVAPGIIATDFFVDASMIKPTVGECFTDFANPKDWYFSFGPSIRFCIQQFPIRLLFASTFQFENGGIAWKNEYGNPVDSFKDSFHVVLSLNVPNR